MHFGSPYSRGIFPAELRNRSYRGPGMAPALKRERSRAFIRLSRACVGSLVRLLYVLVSASNALIFPSYAVWSMMTVAFPLSAGAMTMVSASLSALMAFCSSGERLLGGGLDLAKQPAILVLVSCASDGHTLLRPLSTAAIISGTGILLGAGAKFKPLANTPFSATDRALDDRLPTHLSLGRRGCEPPEDWFNNASNFLFCRSLRFSVLSCWILVRTSSKASACGGCKWNSSCRRWKNRSYLSSRTLP